MSDLYRIVEDFDGDLGYGERNARVRLVEPDYEAAETVLEAFLRGESSDQTGAEMLHSAVDAALGKLEADDE